MFSNFFRIFFNVFINREVCGLFSLQRGINKENGFGCKSAVLKFQHGCDRDSSVGLQSGGLTLQHGCDK